jgi:hypothetical protein
MAIGPIQFIGITFDDFRPKGEILPALQKAVGAGMIRLVDLQFLHKDQEGKVTSLDMSGLSSSEAAEFGAVITGLLSAGAGMDIKAELPAALAAVEQSYGLNLGDVRAVIDRIRPGTAAGLLVIEHTWAIGFRDAVARAGGKMAVQGFLTPQAVMMVGKELEAILGAEIAVALSEAIQLEAALEAAEAVIVSDAIQQEAARRAVQALVAARLIEEAAVEEAGEVVAAALAVEQAAIDRAKAAQLPG